MVRAPRQGEGRCPATFLWLLPAVFVSAIAMSYIICVATFQPSSARATPVAPSILPLSRIEPSASLMTAGPQTLLFGIAADLSTSAAGTTIPSPNTALRRFHVAGEYQDRAPAEAAAAYLRRRGYAVHIVPGQPYGVRVGGFLDRATADRLATALRSFGLDASMQC